MATRHSCPECGLPHFTPAERAERDKIFALCAECKQPCSEDYMLRDDVWASTGIGLGPMKGVLHLQCVEKRLGRRLRIEDFTDKPANKMLRWAWQRGGTDG